MNIVHLCLNGPYTDNWTYQENIIPRFHVRFGNKVTVIAQNYKHLNNGMIVEVDCSDYILDDGVRVIRVSKDKKFIKKFADVFPSYSILDKLIELKPDFIMIHGMIGSIAALQVVKYKKKYNSNCKVVADIHEDYYNTPFTMQLKKIMLRGIRRIINKIMYKYYSRIFYMAPSCKIKAKEYYKAPDELLELLPLGCEFEYINRSKIVMIRNEIRTNNSFSDNDILICHGGKIDINKKTIELIKAVIKLNKENPLIKMILFGALSTSIEEEIKKLINNNSNVIKYLGMQTPESYYKILQASDIAAFPGGQSVLWQQAICCGLATIVRRHSGIEYLDLGGNIAFFENASEEEIYKRLRGIIVSGQYKQMKKVALEKSEQTFSYEKISLRVLDFAHRNNNG